MGLALGALTIVLLFERGPLSVQRIVLSASLASIYWLCIFAAPVFPGTAFSDPEFASTNPNPMGIPAQLFIGFVLMALLLAAVCLAVLTRG
jgi:hypothetical protein